MGRIAEKIAKKIKSHNKSKIVHLDSWREGRKLAIEAGFGGPNRQFEEAAELDPCYAMYVAAQHFASLVSESLSGMREVKGYVRTVEDAEEEYMPQGPPMSPLTLSHFTLWAMFDVRFGASRETMGGCILRVASEFDCPPWMTGTLEQLHRSRMGFYVHCGSEGDTVMLREVGTQDVVPCLVPAGYVGSEGEIWFVRLLAPPDPLCSRHIVMITPYVIRGYTERAYVDYLVREHARMAAKRLPRSTDRHEFLMKYGPDADYWNEYIFLAYSNFQREAIFLTGIPDIPESLPHA